VIPQPIDKAPRHKWGDPVLVPAAENADGCDHNERTCVLCGLVKLTVMPPQGYPWRAWRTANGQRWDREATQPCVVAMAS
jgi:hypothetical protein